MDDKMIKCPSCGQEIPADSENCPECNAPISVLGDNKAAGTPIDNSAAINEMLQNSSALVEESEALGVGSLDSPDDEDAEEEIGFQPSAGGTPPEATLTPEQQKALKEGGVIELKPTNPDLTPHPVKKGKKSDSGKGKSGKAAKSEKEAAPVIPGIPGIPGIPSAAPLAVENGGLQIFEVDDNEQNKKKRQGKKKGSFLSTLIAVVLALVIGGGIGFFGKMFFFPDIKVPSCQSFAQESAGSVLKAISGASDKFYVLKAYVREGAVAKQCLIRAIYDDDENPVPKWYRVKVENGSEEAVHVYIELDDEEYETLKNSTDEGDRIKAAMLSSIQEETNRCIGEIYDGLWEEANAAAINNTINPLQ